MVRDSILSSSISRLRLRINHDVCVGLFVVTGVGFCSGMSLLLCIAEYLLGLRMVSRMRNRMKPFQFVELTQFDPDAAAAEDCDDGSEPRQPVAKQQQEDTCDDVAEGACPPPA